MIIKLFIMQHEKKTKSEFILIKDISCGRMKSSFCLSRKENLPKKKNYQNLLKSM